MKKVIISRFKFSDEVFKYDTSSRDRIFRDQRLEAEREQMIERNMQLQLTNAQMTLNNSSLELNRTREAARLAKIEREHNQLHYNHQQLRNKQLSDSIASQCLLSQARERQLRIEHFTQFLIIAVALVLMLLTTIHVLRKRFLVNLGVLPHMANCVEVMKKIYDADYAAVNKMLTHEDIGGYITYIDVAYNKRIKNYPRVLDAMRRYNILAYGESNGAFAPGFMQMGSVVTNTLAELDRRRAANENSRIELTRINLELTKTQLELNLSRDSQLIANTAAESQRLTYNNQRLLARQLSDSLATQRLLRKASLEKAESDRIRFVMSLGAILVVMAFCIMYIIRNNRIAKQLKRTNINLHRTHHSLSIATAEAMEADRNKTEFMQNMSHEIRTPLNAIVGFTQVLVGDDTPLSTEERLNMTKIVSSNTEVLNNLVNEILDLTSIETDKYVFKKDNVSINSICHRALSAANHLKPKDVSLLFEEQLPNSFCLVTDADRVNQVLYNLLTNALKNTTQGSVVLDCTADGNSKKLTLSVTDTGIGVPKDKQNYIFERFSKLDTFKQGVGLGLDICRIIAQKLGGTIDIDPTYTNGARFVFTLPLVSCS